MAERESPEPVQQASEAPEGESASDVPARRVPSAPGEEGSRSPAARTFFERMDRIEETLRELGAAIAPIREVVQRVGDEAENQREYLTELTRQVADALGAAMRSAVEAVEERAATRVETVRSAISRLEERLGAAVTGTNEAIQLRLASALEAVGTQLGGLEERVRERLEAVVAGDDPDTVRALPRQLAEGMAAIREAIADMARAQAGLEGRLNTLETDQRRVVEETASRTEETASRLEAGARTVSARLAQAVGPLRETVETALQGVREQLETMRQDVSALQGETGDLRAGLAQVDRLSEALDSLGRRRGLRDLAEVDRQVREQQAALFEELAAAGERLGDQMRLLEERFREAADAGEIQRLQGELAERMSAALEEMRGSLAEALSERLSVSLEGALEGIRQQVTDAVPDALTEAVRAAGAGAAPERGTARELREIAKSQREIDRALASVRGDVGDMKRRIAAWGRYRGAAKIAEEVAALEGRVVDVERAVHEDLVDEVFDRMQRVFDRRFDALVQLIDARLRPQPAPGLPEPSRRGLFRRTREET